MPTVYPSVPSCSRKVYDRLKDKYKNGIPYNPGTTKSAPNIEEYSTPKHKKSDKGKNISVDDKIKKEKEAN